MEANRKVSMIIFISKDGKILLQNREGISKVGEEFGFFGGKIEEGETPIQTLIREIKEELEYDLDEKELIKFGEYYHEFSNRLNVFAHVYLMKFPGFDSLRQREGISMELFTVKDARRLKINNLDKRVLSDFELRIKETHKNSL